ncbi:MAG: hypothetical protein M3N37_08310, partial [Actinomycetota bacterium]|nr:hypothetical protein [Actinomycetota bacterium]
MTDPRLEDHAVGVELQLTELVEKRERAMVQGRSDRAAELTVEIEALQADLAATAERIAGEHYELPDIVEEEDLDPPDGAG